MQPESIEPVRSLRARIAAERRVLEDLGRNFTHASMKEWVNRALIDLDDVETVFIGRLDKGSRTAAEEAEIVRNAEHPLQLAIQERKKLRDFMATRGTGAVRIS
jgi:hypothetical protein